MQPLKELTGVSVVAELFECRNLRANWDNLAEDLHFRRAAFDGEASRARRLKSNENDSVLRIGQTLCQMMLNAAAGDHPARRNDDAGRLVVVNVFRFLSRLRKDEALPCEWRSIPCDQ